MRNRLILSTPSGSRLYGLSHALSDYDTFEVYCTNKRLRQLISGDRDRVRMGLKQFQHGLEKGVPQCLEALWSREKTVNELAWLESSFVPGIGAATVTYLRTIKSFWQAGDHKRRRHACRLHLNLLDLQKHGRFNPTLDAEQRRWVEWAACREDPPAL